MPAFRAQPVAHPSEIIRLVSGIQREFLAGFGWSGRDGDCNTPLGLEALRRQVADCKRPYGQRRRDDEY